MGVDGPKQLVCYALWAPSLDAPQYLQYITSGWILRVESDCNVQRLFMFGYVIFPSYAVGNR